MFQEILIICIVFFHVVFFARKRHRSKRHILRLHMLQLSNLIFSPIAAMIIISMGLEILQRKEVRVIPVSSEILFFSFLFSILIVLIGIAIHSTSATVSDLFVKKGKGQERAYRTSEFFHGPFSHHLGFFGCIFIAFFLMLLDLNHPASPMNNMQLVFSLLFGIFIGFLQAMCVVYSYFHYIKYVFLASGLGSIIVIALEKILMLSLLRFPIGALVTASFLSMTAMLFASLFLTKPKNANKKGIIYRIMFAGQYYFEE